MAIQFARIEIVSRKTNNACCKGAYNSRSKITDQRTGNSFDFSKRDGNAHHEILLPKEANKKFKNVSILMNEVERTEKQKNSQLLKDIVIALPDDKELNLTDRINITHRIIDSMNWVKEGLGVQIDIHKPHDGEKNWHAHLLVTTRRFTECGEFLSPKKARDLNPEFKTANGKNFILPEENIIHEKGKRIINDYFKELGLENRVDAISGVPQEHIGPVRMRSVLNQAAVRNKERKEAEIELLGSYQELLKKVTRHASVFNEGDLRRAAKYIIDSKDKEKLIQEALSDKSVLALFKEDGTSTNYFTTKEVRYEEEKILRLSGYVANGSSNLFVTNKIATEKSARLIKEARKVLTLEQHKALQEMLKSDSGIHILRGRAGVGKSHVLGQVARIAKTTGVHVVGLAATHKAKEVLKNTGFENTDTIKAALFKLHNARLSIPENTLLVVDEAGMIGNDDFSELLRVAATRRCRIILSGDEKQLAAVSRGGMFAVLADKYGSSSIFDIKRQDSCWGREVSTAFADGDVLKGVTILKEENRVCISNNLDESMQILLQDWNNSKYSIEDRLILAVKNSDVASLNHGVRQYLKLNGRLTGQEFEVAGNHFMAGDRVLIKATDKQLGVVNGDIGELTKVSKDKFTILLQASKKEVSFNPAEWNDFQPGYATTVFKAQGASIKDVYVCHSGFAGIKNSYVALSRNIEELKLYINTKNTANQEVLIRQLSQELDTGSSLQFLTETDKKAALEHQNTLENTGAVRRMLLGAYARFQKNITKLTDKYLPKSEYYNL